MLRLTARRLRAHRRPRLPTAATSGRAQQTRGMAFAAAASTPSQLNKPGAKTGIVMLNMGGPPELKEVNPFLRRLFTDPDIIPLGKYQDPIGRFMARRRTPKIEQQYAAIGGGSPIAHWTHVQGEEFVRKLTALCSGTRGGAVAAGLTPTAAAAAAAATAAAQPGSNEWFNYYISFRYAPPLTETALLRMKQDGVTRAVAFSQYPQWSCTTSGSSLNHLWSEVERLGLTRQFQWSVIDRWHNHPLYIKAVVQRIRQAIVTAQQQHAAASSGDAAPLRADEVLVVFSAHSVPMKVVYKGDPYVTEIFGTAELVMTELRRQLHADATASSSSSSSAVRAEHAPPSYSVSWQSKVGYLPWMGPKTIDVVQQFVQRFAVPQSSSSSSSSSSAAAAAVTSDSASASASALPLQPLPRRARALVLVPIAFTSDHIETLYELDVEAKRLFDEALVAAQKTHGGQALQRVQFVRAPSLNDSQLLTDAQAQIVYEHLQQTNSLPVACASSASVSSANGGVGLGSVLPRAVHYSSQYPLRCGGCVNPRCRSVINPVSLL